MPKIDKLTAAGGNDPVEGAGQDRPMRVPRRRRAAAVRDHLLSPPSAARRRDVRRARHRAAEGLARRSFRPAAPRPTTRPAISFSGRRGCPMNDVDRSNRTRQPATRVDPITGAVIQGALENIAIEMGHKLMRMSYSSIIRESEDFGAALTDAEGRQLCECKMSTPLQSGPDPRLCPRHPQATRGARRCVPPRRRDHAQRSLWRRLARPRRRRSACRCLTATS